MSKTLRTIGLKFKSHLNNVRSSKYSSSGAAFCSPFTTSTSTTTKSSQAAKDDLRDMNLKSLAQSESESIPSLQNLKIPKNCVGCGAEFQNSSKLKPGYLPPINIQNRALSLAGLTEEEERRIDMIEKSTEPITPKELKLLLKKKKLGSKKSDVIVCWKCHSSVHQNLLQKHQSTTLKLKTNRTQFAELKVNNGGLLILVLDMMDMPNSIVENLTEYVGQKRLIIVLNKADLMPKKFNWAHITAYLKRHPIGKDATAIIPISTTTGEGMDLVAGHILKTFSKGHDCYLVGCTNAGKSSFMNYWKAKMGHQTMITTSITSGTTAGLLKLPTKDLWPVLISGMQNDKKQLSDPSTQPPESAISLNLIDTAGIVKENQLYHYLTPRQLKYLAPTKPLTEHTLTLRPNTSYWIGGLARIDVGSFSVPLHSNEPFVKLHVAPKLKVFPSPIGKFPTAPKTMEKLLTKLPPILWSGKGHVEGEDAIDLKVAAKYVRNDRNKQQVWISGVGWFCFSHHAPRFSFEVHSHAGKGVCATKVLDSSSL